MKKGLLIGCGVGAALLAMCGGAIGLLIYSVFALTAEPVNATDRLLALVSEGKIAEAYQATAAGLKSSQSEPQFAESMQRLGLQEYQSSLWLNRRVNNNQATLRGSVTTRTGGSIPLTVTLIHEGGAWKVLSVQGARGTTVEPDPPCLRNQNWIPEQARTGRGGLVSRRFAEALRLTFLRTVANPGPILGCRYLDAAA